MSAGKLEWTRERYRNVAVGSLSFTAEELRDLAYLYGPSDGALEELLAFADEVDRANGVDGRAL